jgi:hypothetical protein
MPSVQTDLFRVSTPASAKVLREEERFGRADAKCGLPLRNLYSKRIFGERLVAYERGFREERMATAAAVTEGERNAERC